jgi:hypothetical protein
LITRLLKHDVVVELQDRAHAGSLELVVQAWRAAARADLVEEVGGACPLHGLFVTVALQVD